MAEKIKRLDGFLGAVKTLITNDKAQKSKLIDWVERHTALVAESEELASLAETLPNEIDDLLRSGRMDDKTIEKLARKRAHLDLLPARQDRIADALETLGGEFEGVSMFIEDAVQKASSVFFDQRMEQAVSELMALGVSKDIAERQAVIRDDIQAIQPMGVAMMCGGTPDIKSRKLLAAFEAFEAGLHPSSPEAAKFKTKWCPGW